MGGTGLPPPRGRACQAEIVDRHVRSRDRLSCLAVDGRDRERGWHVERQLGRADGHDQLSGRRRGRQVLLLQTPASASQPVGGDREPPEREHRAAAGAAHIANFSPRRVAGVPPVVAAVGTDLGEFMRHGVGSARWRQHAKEQVVSSAVANCGSAPSSGNHRNL